VQDIQSNTSESSLREIFGTFGAIESTKIHNKGRFSQAPLGFIQFSTDAEADKAVLEMNGTMVGGKAIRASIVNRRGQAEHETTTEPCYLAELAALREAGEFGKQPAVFDGVVPGALVIGVQDRHRPQRTIGNQSKRYRADGEASAARTVAGQMVDVGRSAEMQRATVVPTMLDVIEASIGSMRSTKNCTTIRVECEACDEPVTKRWHVAFDAENSKYWRSDGRSGQRGGSGGEAGNERAAARAAARAAEPAV
jgi:hypothetical protein